MIRDAKEIPYFLEKNISYLSREFAAQASEWFNTFMDQIRRMHNAEFNSKQPQIRHAGMDNFWCSGCCQIYKQLSMLACH